MLQQRLVQQIPLYYAAERGYIDVFQILLANGTNIEAVNEVSLTI